MPPAVANQTVALMGLLQATAQVHLIATRGMTGQDDLTASLRTLFVFDADDALGVYGGLSALRMGVRVAYDLFVLKDFASHVPSVRYAVELLARERPIARDERRMTYLRTELERIASDHGVGGETEVFDSDCIGELAGLFESVLARDGARIQVVGAQEHLRRDANVARVRALLLAGFRSAVLWRQLGGSRLRLLLGWGATREAVRMSHDMLTSNAHR